MVGHCTKLNQTPDKIKIITATYILTERILRNDFFEVGCNDLIYL